MNVEIDQDLEERQIVINSVMNMDEAKQDQKEEEMKSAEQNDPDIPQVDAAALIEDMGVQNPPGIAESKSEEDNDENVAADSDQDDDEIIDDLNAAMPGHLVGDPSVMGINDDQDEIARFCAENGILAHLETFHNYGFDSVKILTKLTEPTLKEMGLSLGQAMKVDDIFENYRNEGSANKNDEKPGFGGNIHYLRKMQKKARATQNDNDVNEIDDAKNNQDVLLSEQINGQHQIKYVGSLPSMALRIKLQTKALNIMLLCPSNDPKIIRKRIDDGTKNGDISIARYWYDQQRQQCPNAPANLAYGGSQIWQKYKVWSVTGERYIEKGCGGHPQWTFTNLQRSKLSDAYNELSPSGRQEMHGFIKRRPGLDIFEYARRTGDVLNCRAIGLIGMVQPQFDKTLEEIIAANDAQ